MWNEKELDFINLNRGLIDSGNIYGIRDKLVENLDLDFQEKAKIFSCINYLINGVKNFYYINKNFYYLDKANGAATSMELILRLERTGDIRLTSVVSNTRLPEIKNDPNFKLKIEESLVEKGYPEEMAKNISQGAEFRNDKI